MSQIREFVTYFPPLSPMLTVNEVADIVLSNPRMTFLSLPVLGEDGYPVGSISRYALQSIFMRQFGRELQGRRPIRELMNSAPIIIKAEDRLENAAKYLIGKVSSALTEDFIVVEESRYLGMGSVMDVLKAMEAHLNTRNVQLMQAYSRLKSSQSQLIQAEKMSSLGQMVAGVAHEINTPLGYVRSNIEIAREVFSLQSAVLSDSRELLRIIDDESADANIASKLVANIQRQMDSMQEIYPASEVEGLFDDTLHGVGHMSEIVRSLKDFSRLDQVPVDNVDINACLDSSLLIAHNQIKQRVQVIKEYGDLPKVRCRPSQINQVLLNLITNAAQAVTGQGRILLKTWADITYANVMVEDNGCGIAEDKLKKIFEPFFTTKPVGKGTGLGLSVVYNIVREHKGRIKVASTLGKGTRFTVSLPISEELAIHKELNNEFIGV